MTSRLVSIASRMRETVAYAATSPATYRYMGWLGYENLGDEALYLAFRGYFPELRFAHWITRPGRIKEWSDRLLAWKRHRGLFLGGGTLIGTDFVRDFEKGLDRWGKGVVFGLGVEDPAFWAALGRPHRPVALEPWAEALRRCVYVGVRGPESARLLKGIGVEAEVLGDPAAWFAQGKGYWQPEEKVVGFNIGCSRGQVWGDEGLMVEQVGEAAKRYHERGWRVEFFVVWPPDLAPTQAVAAGAGIEEPVIHRIYEDPDAYLEQVRRMRLFVGIKLHAVVLAMCAQVPSIMVEYQPKCLDFMKSIGMERFNVRSDRVSGDEIEALGRTLEETGEAVAEELHRGLNELKSRQSERAKQVRAMLEG